ARWIIAASDLPPASAPASAWDASLAAWRERWHAPAWLTAAQGELRLPLNLDCPLDRAVLRDRLDRSCRLELRETPGPGARSWSGRPCEFVLPLVSAALSAARPPRVATTQPPAAWSPAGAGEVIAARILGHPARYPEILTGHLRELLVRVAPDLTRWWH